MRNKQHSPLYEGEIPQEIRELTEEYNFVNEKYRILCDKVIDERLAKVTNDGKMCKAEYEDCIMQKNSMEEYIGILERRMKRAFEKEGIK